MSSTAVGQPTFASRARNVQCDCLDCNGKLVTASRYESHQLLKRAGFDSKDVEKVPCNCPRCRGRVVPVWTRRAHGTIQKFASSAMDYLAQQDEQLAEDYFDIVERIANIREQVGLRKILRSQKKAIQSPYVPPAVDQNAEPRPVKQPGQRLARQLRRMGMHSKSDSAPEVVANNGGDKSPVFESNPQEGSADSAFNPLDLSPTDETHDYAGESSDGDTDHFDDSSYDSDDNFSNPIEAASEPLFDGCSVTVKRILFS